MAFRTKTAQAMAEAWRWLLVCMVHGGALPCLPQLAFLADCEAQGEARGPDAIGALLPVPRSKYEGRRQERLCDFEVHAYWRVLDCR